LKENVNIFEKRFSKSSKRRFRGYVKFFNRKIHAKKEDSITPSQVKSLRKISCPIRKTKGGINFDG